MRKFMLSLGAMSLVVPAAVVIPTAPALAKKHTYRSSAYRHGRYCTHSGGTTGAIAGAAGGALVGNSIFGHGALGTVAGGVGGLFAGRAIDRTITAHRRCRNY